MKLNTDNMKSRLQVILDELLNQRLIPFALTAHKVTDLTFDEYHVSFYDSRMHSINFTWKDGDLASVVRTAVSNRVKRLSGPLKGFLAA
jgi:hypothetical protein